jgi:hypothetical protein
MRDNQSVEHTIASSFVDFGLTDSPIRQFRSLISFTGSPVHRLISFTGSPVHPLTG